VDLPSGLPLAWCAIGWVAAAVTLGWAAWRAPWARLLANEQSHVFLGAIVAIALLWTIAARIGPLIHVHLLGATLLYLMFGAPLALLAIAAGAAVSTLAGDAEWSAFGARLLAAGVVPIVISHWVLRLAEARLPANFFIYVFVGGFLGGGLAMLGTSLASTAIIAFALPAGGSAFEAWTATPLMLAFGEATLTGMLATLFVVYQPAWVGTFSDRRYLARDGR
jgi:uncharacterized membrane protein